MTSQEEESRAQESKPMVAVPMWREDQSPAITAPLRGKRGEAGTVTCQQEDRRAICSSHLSLALPNVKGQT